MRAELLSAALGCSVALMTALPVRTETELPVEIREWPVPWEASRPRDPYAQSATSIWFVGQTGHYLGHLDVDTGEFSKVELPDDPGPHNVIVDKDGIVWYAGNHRGYIGCYDPSTGKIEKIAMPDEDAADPHTLALAPDGRIWFTVQSGNFVGRLDPRSRRTDLVRVPTSRARPYGIVVSSEGTPWVALFGTNQLAHVDPDSLELHLHSLPRQNARPRRVGLTSDGRVWYVDYTQGRLGAYDPADGAFQEWPAPSGTDARPYGMAVDGRDRIWFVETGPQPNRFVGFDPSTESFFGSTPIASGGGTVRHMHFHLPTQTIWFGTDTNTIGRAALR